ncbi:MAG TPA: hypothetical protein VJ302_11050, partial [Blastocatellia bacterium]|nr:hypothetical protein [Blastocatellia bacterium]
MSRVRNATAIILVAMILAGIAAGQKRGRTKSKPSSPAPSQTASSATRRSVIVNLIEGGQVTGIFLRADPETVQLEVESGRITVKLSEIASLVFTTDDAGARENRENDEASTGQAATSNPTLPIARKAYAALSKMADAAQFKLPYPQYGSLLIEVKSVVEEAAAELPDDALKSNLLQALEAYRDAAKAYSAAQPGGRIPISSEPGNTLMRKYEIRPEANNVGQADH